MATLHVRVTPRASANRIELKDGKWRVYVTAAPADGQANSAIIELLAKTLKLPKSSIVIVAGHSAREKKIELTSITDAQLQERLAGL